MSSSYSLTAAVPEDGGWKVAGGSAAELFPEEGPPERLGLMITLELPWTVQEPGRAYRNHPSPWSLRRGWS